MQCAGDGGSADALMLTCQAQSDGRGASRNSADGSHSAKGSAAALQGRPNICQQTRNIHTLTSATTSPPPPPPLSHSVPPLLFSS